MTTPQAPREPTPERVPERIKDGKEVYTVTIQSPDGSRSIIKGYGLRVTVVSEQVEITHSGLYDSPADIARRFAQGPKVLDLSLSVIGVPEFFAAK